MSPTSRNGPRHTKVIEEKGIRNLMTIERETPYQKAHFIVEIDGVELTDFFEVHLPQSCSSVIEYRSGNDNQNLPQKVPGLITYTPLVLSRHFDGRTELYAWWDQIKKGALDYKSVAIQLLAEAREPVAVWQFTNCFPSCYYFSSLDAESSGMLTETIELSFQEWRLE